MKDILSEIIAHKRIEIEQQKQAVSLSQLQEQVVCHDAGSCRNRSFLHNASSAA